MTTDGKLVFLELLCTAEAFATPRFQDQLDELEARGQSYLPPLDRVELLKHRGTIRMAVGQKCGQTTAVGEFIQRAYRGCPTVYLSPAWQIAAKHFGAQTPDTVFNCWNNVGRLDPRGVRAVFVDPGPHAGSTAREAIYNFAAEAMVADDRSLVPVMIYFIGT